MKIQIDNKEYIPKEEYLDLEKELIDIREKLKLLNDKSSQKLEVKRFPVKDEMKLTVLLLKIFNGYNEVAEDYLIKNERIVTDPSNVCGVWGKSEEAKRLLSKFVNLECDKDIPKLNFKSKDADAVISSKFALEYFERFMQIIKVTSDTFRISCNKDYPVQIENKDFCFLLAPRIESGEEE